jgi:hypothetical protein
MLSWIIFLVKLYIYQSFRLSLDSFNLLGHIGSVSLYLDLSWNYVYWINILNTHTHTHTHTHIQYNFETARRNVSETETPTETELTNLIGACVIHTRYWTAPESSKLCVQSRLATKYRLPLQYLKGLSAPDTMGWRVPKTLLGFGINNLFFSSLF